MDSKRNSKKKIYPTDEEKYTHRDAFKGHRTLKHYIDSVLAEEAEKDIRDLKKKGKNGDQQI